MLKLINNLIDSNKIKNNYYKPFHYTTLYEVFK